MPLWARIGTIFFIVHLVISSILSLSFYQGEFNYFGLFALTIDLPIIFLGCSSSTSLVFPRFCYPIVGSIFYFILGAMIGLIVGKIKSKK